MVGLRWRGMIAIVALLAVVVSACGRSSGANNSGTTQLAVTTKAGTKPVDKVVWAVYRDVNSLDPIYAFDHPDNTTDSLLYESLLRQGADGSVGPGLATLTYTNPTTLVFTLKSGVTFWDGNPLTTDDVVYSLNRNIDPALAGFYPAVFTRVQSIAATAHGLDGLAPEGAVDLAPQVPDVDLDDVGVAFEREVPYLVEQLLLRHGLAGPAQQLLQHRELAGRELDIDVSPAAPVRPRVQDEVDWHVAMLNGLDSHDPPLAFPQSSQVRGALQKVLNSIHSNAE